MDKLDEKSYTKGYIDGLHAAALVCEARVTRGESRFAPLIRSIAQKMLLKLEAKNG